MTFIILRELTEQDTSEVGGKAANLGVLHGLGLTVPSGFVITASSTASILSRMFVDARSNPDGDDGRTPCPPKPEAWSETALPEDFVAELTRHWEALGTSLVSVRSSGTIEDSERLSFAGVFTTTLNVSKSQLAEAVTACLASMYSTRAVAYCRRNGISPALLRMAIVVQTMIHPEVSGICFTAHPVTGVASEMYIEVAPGYGDAIASGRVTPDGFVYDASGRRLLSSTRGSAMTDESSVGSGAATTRPLLLSDELLHRLADDCLRIQAHYGRPQDIEFAIQSGDIYYLQARPITTC